jgi:Right handed beta helix region
VPPYARLEVITVIVGDRARPRPTAGLARLGAAGLVLVATVVLPACRSDWGSNLRTAPSTTTSTAQPTTTTRPTTTTAPPTTTTSATPSTTQPTTTRPAPTGYPTASSTGVPPGTHLEVVTGDQTFAVDGQVIEGKEFRGFVTVTASNVTFRNCLFRGRATDHNAVLLETGDGSNTVVEDSEFVPANPSATIDGLGTASTSIYRANIHGSVDGVKAGSDTLIQDSYIHDMSWFPSDPNQGGGPTHNDGVQSFGGDSGVTLRHNTIDMSSNPEANAALQSSATDVHVEDNLLDGGGCTLNFDHTSIGRPLTGIYVVGNRFGPNSFYDCPILVSTQTTLSQNSGNVWDDSGEPIPLEQRHD